MEELLELGPGSELGRGLRLARDSRGVYVAEAPKSLRLRQGDRVLGARVSFEGATPEAVGRLLEGAGGCRVSLHLRRGTPGTPEGQRDSTARLPMAMPAAPQKPPAAAPAAAAAPLSVELALPKLPKLPKPRGAPSPVPPEPPRPPRPRLTVREAAAARTPPPEPPELPPAGSGPRIPAVEVAAPKGSLGLSPPPWAKGSPATTPDGAGGDEEGAPGARGGFPALRVPSVPIDVPKAAVELVPELGLASPEPPGGSPDAGSRFAEGLRKLSRELEAPAVEIAPKPPKFRLPRLGWALAKLREGGGTPPASPTGIAIPSVELDLGAVGDAGAKLKVPKLSLAPFGDIEDGPRFAIGAAPGSPRLRAPRFGIAAAALPKFGGSSPDLRPGGVPKAPPKRGGSAESLILGWTAPEPPGTLRSRPKSRGASAPPWPPRIPIPAVGFALPGAEPGPAPERPEARRAPEPPVLKVPVLELAPPGLDGTSEPPGRRFGVKLPKFGAGSSRSGAGSSGRMRRGGSKPVPEEGGAPRDGNPRRRRWVPRVGFTPGGASPEPPKLGRMRFPDVELCPGDPQIPGIGGISSRCDPGGLRAEGTPKFQLPQLVLSPQICGEP
ncbi:nascent polypeptide-associated complex subunit alpha, muscle-specific form-like [Haemorhous mexicanus]|uniref:nascent polypeptide-associated complex subunit alpha, muscle-specific form-like n=1 Tax=Haemorhous mexicanus TaxID=30427 RepID=UPI0028BEB334|nr:nascent polypeptide-associated complex subunit alpha, muscle-specific form-like [Haemorhous mexicanus]